MRGGDSADRIGRAPAISGVFYIGLTVTDAASSATWYERILGFEVIKRVVLEDGRLYQVQLHHRPSDTTIGLIQHRVPAEAPFSEFRVGLDHFEFNVPTSDDLERWAVRLDELGVAHSAITERPGARMVTFRDPDNIQLELYWRRPKP
jgi:catechol 2,3-dioxygenase-like lactoylglutathione lyase family enzyme